MLVKVQSSSGRVSRLTRHPVYLYDAKSQYQILSFLRVVPFAINVNHYTLIEEVTPEEYGPNSKSAPQYEFRLTLLDTSPDPGLSPWSRTVPGTRHLNRRHQPGLQVQT